ncbi:MULTISPECIES: TetR/AcrR family transcriptional regulator [Protofrankia]|uniref:Regulatory protein TetR n=1 Tax=Candidatus Protofrankia datiscae TaxID=2716812 RepID=F8AZH0_9ACTN|nr:MULTISPECIES: TetR/AcrR family transcriptional regulator [Protofrankia]AEH08645.1 regulatory protein TetR [Candidatus Protofrankia datiscae]
MPKRVDHDVRRRQIADALLRVAATRGLHNAGFREVAAEAGVSVRLIQYYFETKEQLLLFGLRRVGEQFGQRVAIRLTDAAATPSGRDRIELVLLTTLPLDEDCRLLYLVYNQYFALALTEPTLAAQPYGNDPDILATWLVEQLRACQAAGHLPPHTNLADEAVALLAITVGLGNAVLAGTRSAHDARRVLAGYLDRLLSPPAHGMHQPPAGNPTSEPIEQ